MQAFRIDANVEADHTVTIRVPTSVPAGPAEVILLYAEPSNEMPRLNGAAIPEARMSASESAAPLSSDELARLKELDGTFGLLGDATDEAIDQIEAGIRRMKKEGFPPRG